MTRLQEFLAVIKRVQDLVLEMRMEKHFDDDHCLATGILLLRLVCDIRKQKKCSIGKIELLEKQISTGLFLGNYEDLQVVVKQIRRPTMYTENFSKILAITSERIIRVHCIECTGEFNYYALEKSECNLREMIQFYNDEDKTAMDKARASMSLPRDVCFWDENNHPTVHLVSLMHQIFVGLVDIHDSQMVHGDLRPENVFIKVNPTNGRLEAKLSKLDIDEYIVEGSRAWQAPECLDQKQPTQSTDIFGLGCLFFYCLTKGNLPFGESGPQNSEFQSILLDGNPEATHLVSLVLETDPIKRVSNFSTMKEHFFFWDARFRLDYICAINHILDNFLESELAERKALGDAFLTEIEAIGPDVFRQTWDKNIDQCFISNHTASYDKSSIRGLLSFITNSVSHYKRHTQFELVIGNYLDEMCAYFSKQWPNLLMELYKVVNRESHVVIAVKTVISGGGDKTIIFDGGH